MKTKDVQSVPSAGTSHRYKKSEFTCENPEYFIAVCTIKGHSYVIVGVTDAATKQQYVCASFSLLPTGFREESMPSRQGGILIDIHAFHMTEEQYKEVFKFIKQQEKNTDDNGPAFSKIKTRYDIAIPEEWKSNFVAQNSQNGNSKKRKFVWEYEREQVLDNVLENKAIKSLDINPGRCPGLYNNCRTIAKDITQKTVHAESLPNVSPMFFRSLPFKAHLSKGLILEKLFIYPPPPEKQNSREWMVLRKIYAQLDNIAKNSHKYHLDKSHAKFDALKELYLKQHHNLTKDQSISFVNLLTDIKLWASDKNNASIIDEHRSNSFFKFKTKSRQVLDNILKDCKKEQSEQQYPSNVTKPG